MEIERVTEFPMHQRPRKRPRLGWDVAPQQPEIKMAGKKFDSHDIRTEMGYEPDVREDVPTPMSPHPESEKALIPFVAEPTPLEFIIPGEPENALNVEDLPDMAELNKVFPPKPLSRRSKRQAGYNPDYTASKRFRGKGQSSRPSLVDAEFSSGDDSSDEDFKLVARPRRQKDGASKVSAIPVPFEDVSESSENPSTDVDSGQKEKSVPIVDMPSSKPTESTSVEATLAFSDDEETSITKFMAALQKQKDQLAVGSSSDSEDNPDEEMLEEYAANRPQSGSSSSVSSSASDAEDDLEEESSGSKTETSKEDVAADVADIQTNILDAALADDYDVTCAYSFSFYSEAAASDWQHYVNREFYEECNINVAAYEAYNLVSFLKLRRMIATVTTATAYCRPLVLEFYCHLTEAVKDPRYARYGKVFVRGKIAKFSPEVINRFLNSPSEDATLPTLDVMTSVITGGLVSKFPAHPQKLSASKLTSLYSVLHKTAVKTWTPSGNSTVVTKHQAPVLYAIGTFSAFNFGRLVFETVMSFADCGLVTYKLPYPSLIYAILESQGIEMNGDEGLTKIGDDLKIAPALLRGTRKIDLPWSNTDVAASVAADVASTSTATALFVPPSSNQQVDRTFIQAQLLHTEQKINQAKADISYYEDLQSHYRNLLGVSTSSGQKGGEVGE